MLFTVSLVGGAGYHADTILAPLGERLSGELQALVYDLRAATLECVELSTCRAHALVWVERDGLELQLRLMTPRRSL